MQIGEVIGWIVSIIIAVIGVSALTINIVRKNNSKKIHQSIKQGDRNIQAGGNVNIHSDTKNGSE